MGRKRRSKVKSGNVVSLKGKQGVEPTFSSKHTGSITLSEFGETRTYFVHHDKVVREAYVEYRTGKLVGNEYTHHYPAVEVEVTKKHYDTWESVVEMFSGLFSYPENIRAIKD